ncbi:MAG: sensor domain-containing diguanylate cyclase [Pirellulales bacterium]
MTRLPIDVQSGLWPLVERAFDGFLLVAADERTIVFANAAAGELFGRSAESLIGRAIVEFFDGSSQGLMRTAIAQARQAADAKVAAKAVGVIAVGGGKLVRVDVRACQVNLESGGFVGIVIKPSGRAAATHVASLSRQDPLTGLPDREFLTARLAKLLVENRSVGPQFAVLFIDMNNFKEVNDRFGHLVGDRVLQEVANRLASVIRDGDHLVRYGGDEFVALIEQAWGPDELEPIVARMHDALATAIVVEGHEVALSLSVGVAMSSAELRTPEEMLAAADRAMYVAKRSAG